MEKTILLVEDNPNDEELTLRALRKANIANNVVVARDGQEAVDFLFGTGPHAGREPPTMPGYCCARNACPSCSAWRYVVTSIASTLFSMELRSRRNPDAPTRSSRI